MFEEKEATFSKHEWLQRMLEVEIIAAREATRIFTKNWKIMMYVKLAISAFLVIILGIRQFENSNDIALIIAAILSVITGLDSFFSFGRRRADTYQATTDLGLLQYELNYYLSGITASNLDDKVVDDIFERFKQIRSTLADQTVKLNNMDSTSKTS